MKTIDPKQLNASAFYQLMVEAVVPRPIAFVSTVDRDGRVNLSPYSFFNVVSAHPPVLVFSPVNRTRDNTRKDTLDNVQEHGEVVVNIVNYAVAEQMSLASTEYDRGVNEFAKAGLTEVPSVRVRPPRVAECPIAFECQVQQVVPLGNEGGAGHLVICEILLAHVDEVVLDAEQRIDPHRLDAVGRMGGSWYCRASGEALFKMARPGREKGVGVDGLPRTVRESTVLTGSDLARLASVPRIPDPATWQVHAGDPLIVTARNAAPSSAAPVLQRLHEIAQDYLRRGDINRAWAALMTGENL